jgi:ADP-heptose:LPS heptosyltransferase
MYIVNLSNAPHKILVIKLGALGDFIYACGAMKAIRAHHKKDHITLLTTAPFEKLGRDSGYFDDIITDPRPKLFQVSKILKWRNQLNARHFTRVYDLQNNDRTALYFKLLSPKPEWVGAVAGASHRNTSPDRVKYHAALGHAATLKIGGIDNVTLDDLSWMRPTSEFMLPEKSVLIVAGSAPSRPQKRWPAAQYRALCSLLIENGFHPVLLGTNAEADVNNFIARNLNVANLTGKTNIYDLPALAKRAVGAIGNDTGPIHILSVTNCKLLALFDARESNVIKHGPQGAQSYTLETSPLSDLSPETVFQKWMEIYNKP